jgi:hypothetical protein
MPRSVRLKPRELVPAWPDGPATDPIGEVARLFADNLRRAIGPRSIRSVADTCGMNHATLIGILDGRAWPDMETIAKLERGLAAPLWPAHPQVSACGVSTSSTGVGSRAVNASGGSRSVRSGRRGRPG